MVLPTTVRAACKVTNQLSPGALSKKCQVQAAMALTRAGIMAIASQRQTKRRLTRAKRQTNSMAAIHSSTLEIWMIQVGRESTCMAIGWDNSLYCREIGDR